jgi:two-component system response regulator HydG
VRELQNCIQGMVAVNTGPVLHIGDAPSHLQHHRESNSMGRLSRATSAAAPAGNSEPVPIVQPVIPLAEMERQAILRALEYTKGDRVMAAHLLGIGRTTLYRKLKEYGIKG